jgi:hypothetical protein
MSAPTATPTVGLDLIRVAGDVSALSSFYRYCAAHDPTGRVPTRGVARPVVDPRNLASPAREGPRSSR